MQGTSSTGTLGLVVLVALHLPFGPHLHLEVLDCSVRPKLCKNAQSQQIKLDAQVPLEASEVSHLLHESEDPQFYFINRSTFTSLDGSRAVHGHAMPPGGRLTNSEPQPENACATHMSTTGVRTAGRFANIP